MMRLGQARAVFMTQGGGGESNSRVFVKSQKITKGFDCPYEISRKFVTFRELSIKIGAKKNEFDRFCRNLGKSFNY